ncbi:MAG: M20 family metallopeptidase [Clostridia bacterium]|nr:M20 family metallopeptidase [Clostridia bacterium]
MKKLLYDMLDIDTQNPPGNERVLAGYIRDYLADTPCEVTIQDVAEGRANVVARLRGRTPGHGVVLNGHLDTVPNGMGWATDPQRAVERDGRVYARGASDMKSGLAAMLCAFRERALTGVQPEHDILFLGTCDEESGGLGAKAAAEAGLLEGMDAVFIGEPTDLGLGLAAKGCLWLKLTAAGKTSHGAYPERGVNAIDGLYGFTRVLKQAVEGGSHPLLGAATATLTVVGGGVKANMVPDRAEAVMDVRTLPGADHAALVERARALAAAWCAERPGLAIDIMVTNDRMPVETRPGSPYAQKMDAVWQRQHGRPMKPAGTAFFSDASVFLRYADCDVVQFGPGESDQAHTPNESASLKACDDALALWRELLGEM